MSVMMRNHMLNCAIGTKKGVCKSVLAGVCLIFARDSAAVHISGVSARLELTVSRFISLTKGLKKRGIHMCIRFFMSWLNEQGILNLWHLFCFARETT